MHDQRMVIDFATARLERELRADAAPSALPRVSSGNQVLAFGFHAGGRRIVLIWKGANGTSFRRGIAEVADAFQRGERHVIVFENDAGEIVPPRPRQTPPVAASKHA